MLQDAGPELPGLVGHGRVLDGSGEHHHVAGVALDLDGVVEELVLVRGILGHDVRVGPDGGAAVVDREVGQQGHELQRLKCTVGALSIRAWLDNMRPIKTLPIGGWWPWRFLPTETSSRSRGNPDVASDSSCPAALCWRPATISARSAPGSSWRC